LDYSFSALIQLSKRKRSVGLEAFCPELADNLLPREKALRLPGELRKHERLTGYGLDGI
jgi:hypothetical protein